MDNNSTLSFITLPGERELRRRRSAAGRVGPSESTLEFIRRFARTYKSYGSAMPEGLRGYSAN